MMRLREMYQKKILPVKNTGSFFLFAVIADVSNEPTVDSDLVVFKHPSADSGKTGLNNVNQISHFSSCSWTPCGSDWWDGKSAQCWWESS